MDRAFELSTKAIKGEPLTDEEKEFLKKRNSKYKIVCYLVKEKLNHMHPDREMVDFHFTPGDEFMDMPIVDIVNAIVNIDTSKATPIDFNDLKVKKADT